MDSLLLSGCAIIGAAMALWMGNKDVEREIKAIVKNTAEDNNLYIQNVHTD